MQNDKTGFNEAEPRLSAYLHARARREGIPLAGTFELTARCNFSCRMCYVHLTEQEQQRRGRELTAGEWLDIAEKARNRGMLFLLLTGGEPLIHPDFRYMLTELKRLGLLVSVNTNGSLIDGEWLEFFRREPPFRFNISLYGAENETYEQLCGLPAFDRVVKNIRALRETGVGVKLNVSLTQHNAADMEKIYKLAEELGAPLQVASYMFPPVRRDEAMTGRNDRFTPLEAAEYAVKWDRLRFSGEQLRARSEAMRRGLSLPREDVCEDSPGEGVACRAGRSTFWIDWQGNMSPCGMMTGPRFSVPELGFDHAWEAVRTATEAIRLPAECVSCRYRHACHACAAMCQAEAGRFDGIPEYICEMTKEIVRLTIEEVEG